MKRLLVLLFLAVPLFAQQRPATTQNPLDKLHDQAKAVFEKAGIPFSEEQEKSVALMIEDRRQASEDLFGQLMDFRGGPVQGQQQDRVVAAIKWMHDEFKKRLREYLNEEQLPVWEKYQAGDGVRALDDLIKELTGGEAPKQETQFIRIVNNAFTAERNYFSGGGVNTDVIQKAGIGAFHGNAAFQFKDESLNARNPFAHNRPPYQERQSNFNFNGPILRNRLTMNVNGNNVVRESAGTIHAITPSGPYDLGITNPYRYNYIGGNVTYQISNAHSFAVGTNIENNKQENQGVGGFNLLERASNFKIHFHNIYFNETAVLSEKTLYRTNVNLWTENQDTLPVTNAPTIDVLGSFGGGGSPGKGYGRRKGYYLNNLFSHTGGKFTVKGGFDGGYRTAKTSSEDNFLGTFTFSNLDAYRQGIADTYRVNRGEPLLVGNQFEMSMFAETEVKLSQRLTTMFGLRYDHQTNLHDHNNAAPRVGFAYALGRSTVIRGGTGIFYDRLYDWMVETIKRNDGTRQYEVVIDKAAYPEPIGTGETTINRPRSIRVLDPDIAAPYNFISSVSVERTFKNTLFISGRYEYRRGVHQYRTRDLNAPLPTGLRPDPTQGSILNLESTALSRSQVFTLSARQRFSIFNINGSYTLYSQFDDDDGYFNVPSDNYNMHKDWSRTSTSRHQFNTTVNAKLIMGVYLTGTMNANSGNHYTVTTGTDDNGDGYFNDRPAGTPRNSGTATGYLNFSFNISKAFFIGGTSGGAGNSRPNLNLFANMNNAFNRTNFGTPSGVVTSPFFGKPYSARDAREVQVGLRFQF